ncbi:MAG: hypothetical protein BWY59_01186 [Verrucomicrobia bacterium ADurb.Bin345]|nr:MAG: hypothetical protein BWY59_01186 [Verrucomicrobia bacterium ADurb.Bin345]
MKFMTVREFRSKTGMVRESLAREEEVVLTSGGKPYAIVSRIRSESFDSELQAIRRARASSAVEHLRDAAGTAGTDRLSMEEINRVIGEVRRKARKSRA